MRIAIADDHGADLITTTNFLRQYIGKHYPEIVPELQLETFLRGEDLLSAFEPEKYDLVVLDIYMEAVTGMQVAETIRLSDANVQIIFLTTSTEHILAGYRVFAAGYFIKPLSENREEFARTFEHIFPQLLGRQKQICVPTAQGAVEVPYRQIFWLDIDYKHRLCVHLSTDTVITSLRYEDVRSALLPDGRFLECHHRILINMDQVKRMDKDDFILKNGGVVPISQRRKKEAKLAYMQYLVHG